MIINANNCWAAAQAEYVSYFDKVVARRLKRFESRLTKKVHTFLVANHDLIRDGREPDFRKLQGDFDVLMNSLALSTQKRVMRIMPKIYNYTSFSNKDSKEFSAYDLCKKNDVLTCPYCNLSYGHTLVVGVDNVLRPTLDHFFDKARYPLFSISIGNLVASCYQCNSTLKGSANFYTDPHMHPQQDSESIKFRMQVDLLKARHDTSLVDAAEIEILFDKNDSRVLNSLNTFYIEQRYQFLVEEARFIAKNMIEYSAMPPNNVRLEWLKRGVNKNNYKNRVLGKLIFDFSEQYIF